MQPTPDDWFAWDGAAQHGPFPLEAIRQRIATGQLPPQTQVKQGGSGAWGPPPAGQGGWQAGPQGPPFSSPSALFADTDPFAAAGRAVVVGALTGFGVVIASGLLLLVRYASRPFEDGLLGDEPKWHVGLAIAIAVAARVLAAGPRRGVVSLIVASLGASMLAGGGPGVGTIALVAAVIVQLRPLHGLLVALPSIFFCWALATRGFNFRVDSPERYLIALWPILVWLGLALLAGVIARRFAHEK